MNTYPKLKYQTTSSQHEGAVSVVGMKNFENKFFY